MLQCLHAAIDPETSLFILVLEDVGQLRHVDQLVGCRFDTLEPRGRELAQIMLDRHLSAVADSDALALYP